MSKETAVTMKVYAKKNIPAQSGVKALSMTVISIYGIIMTISRPTQGMNTFSDQISRISVTTNLGHSDQGVDMMNRESRPFLMAWLRETTHESRHSRLAKCLASHYLQPELGAPKRRWP
jgi:hypothetical protein